MKQNQTSKTTLNQIVETSPDYPTCSEYEAKQRELLAEMQRELKTKQNHFRSDCLARERECEEEQEYQLENSMDYHPRNTYETEAHKLFVKLFAKYLEKQGNSHTCFLNYQELMIHLPREGTGENQLIESICSWRKLPKIDAVVSIQWAIYNHAVVRDILPDGSYHIRPLLFDEKK